MSSYSSSNSSTISLTSLAAALWSLRYVLNAQPLQSSDRFHILKAGVLDCPLMKAVREEAGAMQSRNRGDLDARLRNNDI